jgi:flagellar brake protein
MDALSLPPPDSPHWIGSAAEIRQIFRMLAKKSEKVTLWSSDEQFQLSLVLDVRSDGMAVLDVAVNEAQDERLLKAPRVWLTGSLDRVDVKCELAPLARGTFEGGPALLARLPSRLHKLQRREFFRVSVPLGEPLFCQIPPPASAAGAERHAKPLVAQVIDISLGGVSLVQPLGLPTAPASGDLFEGCSIDFSEEGRLTFDLKVQHVFQTTLRQGTVSRRLGCAFQKLPSAAEAAIQRYIHRLEVERRALLG